jgi:hypothetical protein
MSVASMKTFTLDRRFYNCFGRAVLRRPRATPVKKRYRKGCYGHTAVIRSALWSYGRNKKDIIQGVKKTSFKE